MGEALAAAVLAQLSQALRWFHPSLGSHCAPLIFQPSGWNPSAIGRPAAWNAPNSIWAPAELGCK